MNKLRSTIQVLTLLVFMAGLTSIAHAQAVRTWVSGVGDDLNPCSRTAPCKTFAGAISKTAIHGEIDCLDPGGFGTVTITKSLTIDGTTGAGFGSILASGTTGVIVNVAVNANDPFREVVLRNLSINGSGSSGTIGTRTGIRGINYIAGLSLTVENCQIFAFANEAIRVSLTANGALVVDRSTLSHSNKGVSQTITGGTLNSTITRSLIAHNTATGVESLAGTINISASIFSNNGAGIVAGGAVGSVINADNNDVHNNTTGIQAATAQGTVRINGNAVHRNGTGLSNSGAMQTCANNKVYGNTTDVSGAVVPVAPGSCAQ